MTYHASRIPLAVSQQLSEITADDMKAMGLSQTSSPRLRGMRSMSMASSMPCRSTHPIVLYYNKDKLAAAGLIGADGLPTGLMASTTSRPPQEASGRRLQVGHLYRDRRR